MSRFFRKLLLPIFNSFSPRSRSSFSAITAITLIMLGASIPVAFSQEPTFDYNVQQGDSSFDVSYSVAVDNAGNVYSCGYFTGTVDFDPGASVFNLISQNDFGTPTRDAYVQKLDSAGNFLWAVRVGGVESDGANDLVVDGSGNVYVTGTFVRSMSFVTLSGITSLTSNGHIDMFLIKIDSSGNFLWGNSIGGTSADIGEGIALDAVGNIILNGRFTETADFDPGVGTTTLTSSGGYDVFVAKYSSDGVFDWAQAMGGALSEAALGVATDASNNIYTTGSFVGTADFDPDGGGLTLLNNGSNDIFVQKLDSTGSTIWALGFGGTDYDWGVGIDVDPAGNVFVTGGFRETVDFDPGAGSFPVTSSSASDSFVLKLNTTGGLVWVKQIESNSSYGRGIFTDGSGNVYSVGAYSGDLDLDPSGGVEMVSAVSRVYYLQKLDSSGNYIWGQSAQLTDGVYGFTEAYKLAVDNSDSVYAAGYYQGTVDFDPGAGTEVRVSIDEKADIFLNKVSVPLAGTPSVTSITRADASPTGASLVDFTVNFDEAVTGVDKTDFSVDATGVTGASVSSVTGSGTTWTVRVATGLGNGTLSIDLDDDDTIISGSAVPLGGAGAGNGDYTAGQAYTVDKSVPAVSIDISAPTVVTTTGVVYYTVTYTNASTVNLVEGDVTVNGADGASGSVFVIHSPSAFVRTVWVGTITGSGTIGITIAPGTANDGNSVPETNGAVSSTIPVSGTVPTISIGAPSVFSTDTGPVNFVVTYSGASSVNLQASDITLDKVGTDGLVFIEGGSTLTPKVIITGITGDGFIGFTIGSGTAASPGHSEANGATSTTVTIDNTPAPINNPPVLDSVGTRIVGEGNLLSFVVTASDPDGDDFTIAASNLPGGASFNQNTGTFSWTPDMADVGTFMDLRFTVTDDGTPQMSDFEEIDILVTEVIESICDAMPDILLQMQTFATDFGVLTNDFDGDMIPEEATLMLINAATCNANLPGLASASQVAYDVNLILFDGESNSGALGDYRELIAALMLIGLDTEVALNTILADNGTALTGNYENVACVDVDCLPGRIEGVSVREEYLGLDELARTFAIEPYLAPGDADDDGFTNLEEYNNTIDNGGTFLDYALAASDSSSDGTSPVSLRSGGGGGGGSCIIATATLGTPLANELGLLRRFRDEYLLSNWAGSVVSDMYYRVSPSTSQYVLENSFASMAVRVCLVPILVLAHIFGWLTGTMNLFVLSVCIAIFVRKIKLMKAETR